MGLVGRGAAPGGQAGERAASRGALARDGDRGGMRVVWATMRRGLWLPVKKVQKPQIGAMLTLKF